MIRVVDGFRQVHGYLLRGFRAFPRPYQQLARMLRRRIYQVFDTGAQPIRGYRIFQFQQTRAREPRLDDASLDMVSTIPRRGMIGDNPALTHERADIVVRNRRIRQLPFKTWDFFQLIVDVGTPETA